MKIIVSIILSSLIAIQIAKAQSTFNSNREVQTKLVDFYWTDNLNLNILLPNANKVFISFDKEKKTSKVKKVGANEVLFLDFVLQKDHFQGAYWYSLDNEIGEVLILESYFPGFDYLPSEILNVSIVDFDNQGNPDKQVSFNSAWGGSNLITKTDEGIIINIFQVFTNYKSYNHSDCFYLNKFVLNSNLNIESIRNHQLSCYEVLGEDLVFSPPCQELLEKDIGLMSRLRLQKPYVMDPIKGKSFLFSFNKEILKNKIWINYVNDYRFELLLPNGKEIEVYSDKSNKFSIIKTTENEIKLDFILHKLYFHNAYWYFLNDEIGEVLILESYFPYPGGTLSSIVNVSIISFDKSGNATNNASFNSYRGGAKLIHVEESEIVISIFDEYKAYNLGELVDCYYLFQFTLNDDFSIKPRKTTKPRCYQPWYGNLIESDICKGFVGEKYKQKLKPYVFPPAR